MNAHARNRFRKAEYIVSVLKRAQEDLEAEDNGLNEKQIISAVALNFGSANRYIKELIEDLINMKHIARKDKKLYYVRGLDYGY